MLHRPGLPPRRRILSAMDPQQSGMPWAPSAPAAPSPTSRPCGWPATVSAAPVGRFQGIAREGLAQGPAASRLPGTGRSGVSERGHYSFGKAADLLGIGRDNLIKVETDDNNRIDLKRLREHCRQAASRGHPPFERSSASPAPPKPATSIRWRPWPIWPRSWAATSMWMPPGAGRPSFPTPTGDCCGGIERADSVTIDAHKQLYVPMGAGMVLFKDPTTLSSIEHHAAYIIRQGSQGSGQPYPRRLAPRHGHAGARRSLHHRPQRL